MTNEGKKLTKLCYDLEEKFAANSPIRIELLNLAERTVYYAPVFTLFGLSEINKSTFLALISTLATYLIVTIQFK